MRRRFREVREIKEDRQERSLPVFPDEIGIDDGVNDLPDEIEPSMTFQECCDFWDEVFTGLEKTGGDLETVLNQIEEGK